MSETHVNPVVVILRGPPGVGKTTAAVLLRDRLAPAARLSVDTIRYFTYPRPVDDKYLRAAKLAAARMAVEYAAAGISSVIESVFMEDDILNEVCEVLRRAKVGYYVFALYAPLEEIERRDAGRDTFYRQGGERVKDLHRNFAWMGRVIRTQDKVAEEVVSEILEQLEVVRAGEESERPQHRNLCGSKKLCIFLRHGTYESDPERYGSPADSKLTAEGRAAVAVTASGLVGCAADRLVTSPFLRSVESAAIIGRLMGLVPEIHDGLRERHFRSLVGQEYATLQTANGEEFARHLLYSSESLEIPGEETMPEARARVISTMRHIMTGHGKRVIVVSHGGPYSWLLSAYLGLPLDRGRSTGLAPAHFGLFTYEENGAFHSSLGANLESWDETLLSV